MTSAAVIADGAEHRRIYLTDLEAALGVAGRKGALLPRNTAIDEAGRLLATVKAYRVAAGKEQRAARKRNPDWVPDADQCLALLRITQSAAAAVALMDKLRKIQREERAGYTDEQLEAVWLHKHKRTAQNASPRDAWEWAAIRYGAAVADVLEPTGRAKRSAAVQAAEVAEEDSEP